MKTVLLSILIAALFAGTIFGAPAAIRTPEDPRGYDAHNCFRVPPFWRMASQITGDLDLQAKSAFWLGNYKLAVELFQRLLKSGCKDCYNIYNLACCYGQLGDAEEAARYLRLSVERGFSNIEHIRNDPDFQKVRESPYFQMTIDWIGKELSRKNGE
ncbi:tetratricopeptide repeat protein [candidate division TA06 bacterium]|nr:tetratricopeptide repeat protein [candidate division TA06 bacterium]